MRKFTLLPVLLAALPLGAQTDLTPAAKSVLGKTALQPASGVLPSAAARLPKISPLLFRPARVPVQTPHQIRYVSPGQLTEETLNRLSARSDRLVRLYTASAGTLRSLEEVEAFAQDKSVTAALRVQAFELLQFDFTPRQLRLFLSLYPFLTTHTRFSLENNQWLIKAASAFKKHTEKILRQKETVLAGLEIAPFSAPGQLVARLPGQARLIMLGEVHNRAGLPEQTAEFLKAYRKAFPDRKMVLLSEFLPDSHPLFWRPGQPVPADFFARNPEFSNVVYRQGRNLDMDIYGLENLQFSYQKFQEMSGLDFTVSNTAFRAMTVRNKYWENIIRYVMQKTRRQYPDAVFFVYAGNAHINKSSFESLPSMLQDEKPFCIELRNGFQNGFLGFLLHKDPAVLAEVPAARLLTWKDGKNFAGLIGFDAMLLLPFEAK